MNKGGRERKGEGERKKARDHGRWEEGMDERWRDAKSHNLTKGKTACGKKETVKQLEDREHEEKRLRQ